MRARMLHSRAVQLANKAKKVPFESTIGPQKHSAVTGSSLQCFLHSNHSFHNCYLQIVYHYIGLNK